jgi:hypothetical protein
MTDSFGFQFLHDNVFGLAVVPDIDIVDLCTDVEIGTLNSAAYSYTEESVTVIDEWSDYIIEDGCYYFRLNDVHEERNGDWSLSTDEWFFFSTGTAEWTFVGPGVELDGDISGGTGTATQEYTDLCTLNARIRVVAEADNVEVKLVVNDVVVVTVNVLGTQVITYNIPDGTVVTSVSLFATVGAGEDVVFTEYSLINSYASNPVCVYTDIDKCTNYIEAWNDTDTSQFQFDSTGLKFYLRLHSQIVNPRYPTEEEIYLSSAGQNTLHYARSEKVWDMQITRIAIDTWDALSTIFMMDNLYIDGERYVKLPGDIEPKWSKNNNQIASGTINVKKYLENRKK